MSRLQDAWPDRGDVRAGCINGSCVDAAEVVKYLVTSGESNIALSKVVPVLNQSPHLAQSLQ
jgi:hypothetical protein